MPRVPGNPKGPAKLPKPVAIPSAHALEQRLKQAEHEIRVNPWYASGTALTAIGAELDAMVLPMKREPGESDDALRTRFFVPTDKLRALMRDGTRTVTLTVVVSEENEEMFTQALNNALDEIEDKIDIISSEIN